ncbi:MULTISPECIES: zinc-dependent alcohol dehydrogenase family protein [unclassified Burkholderia]|uniref:zinc-dependent alcohol dehydrogenase family protein n=1 Tax=unclassified Burkholderia TaxID=2613784 RepID=UPI00142270EC|nr:MULTISPECIES: zinc-dependent alcohol dehydrogenase family protein [unclassified Burkholderia]NIE61549.1 zinc-dependent alcohol dehydrogenase family protein [Burkholderia sp. Ap-955]NIF13929.1 zinc-dependent alcohol dehydrogenase family protein [Burkholderia sp. Ax-1735]NIG07043.1 zinc-dependent alcohol dehydrogenase family protein [Burkholderia sp. Tr-849]
MSRIVRFHRVGGPDVLQIDTVDVPAPGPDDIQLRVKAIGLNRAEVMYRTGEYTFMPRLPAALGYEASGIVAAVGRNVTAFAVGDAVSVVPAFSFADYGMYGEVVNVPAHAAVRHPASLSFEEAAATWMMFVTAWGALIELGGLQRGDAVLIGAASSSVGQAAIQIANHVGAVPIALTRGESKRQALLDAGAKHVIVGSPADLPQQVADLTGGTGARLVFDPVGGPDAAKLLRALATNGTFFQYGALDTRDIPVPVMDLLARHLTLRGYELFEITGDAQRLERAKRFIVDGLAAGALKPLIDRTFAFDDIVEAHRYMEAGAQVGKIVVTV